MKRVDVKVGFACNNFCTFCVQGDKRFSFWSKSLFEIEKILWAEFEEGAKEVVFTGWEPTLHPDLLQMIDFAKKYGYESIQIQSNGMSFSQEDYVKKLINAWVTEFSPSIHWFYPQTHDSQVQTMGAWKKVVEGIRILKKHNQKIIVNSVITKQNYSEIPCLSKLLIQLWVSQFQFAFIHIVWSAYKNRFQVVPRKTLVMPYIYKALDIARLYWVPAFTEAIPYCCMWWYFNHISEKYIPQMTIVDAEMRTEDYTKYRISEWKVKSKLCYERCSFSDVCEWPWKEYPELYGWGEFQPIYSNLQ